MRESPTWKSSRQLFYRFQAWLRRTIWGDRVCLDDIEYRHGVADTCQLFLQFHGPSTILLQSQASRVADVLSSDEVNEIAQTPPGAVQAAMKQPSAKEKSQDPAVLERKSTESMPAPRMNIASIGPDHKVTFEAAKEKGKP